MKPNRHVMLQSRTVDYPIYQLYGWKTAFLSLGGANLAADNDLDFDTFANATYDTVAADFNAWITSSYAADGKDSLKGRLENLPNNNEVFYVMIDIEMAYRSFNIKYLSDANKKRWVDGHRLRFRVCRDICETLAGSGSDRVRIGLYDPAIVDGSVIDSDTEMDFNADIPTDPNNIESYRYLVQLPGEDYGLYAGGDPQERIDFICPVCYFKYGPDQTSAWYENGVDGDLRIVPFTQKAYELGTNIADDVFDIYNRKLKVIPIIAHYLSNSDSAYHLMPYWTFDPTLEDTMRLQIKTLQYAGAQDIGIWGYTDKYLAKDVAANGDDLTWPDLFALIENVQPTNLNLTPLATDNAPAFLSYGNTDVDNNLYLIIARKPIFPPKGSPGNPPAPNQPAPVINQPAWEYLSRTDKENSMFSSPLLVADDSILVRNHSGAGSSFVSYGDYILIVYPSNETPGTGTNQYLVVCSRSQNKVLFKKYLTTTETSPGPDNHDIPAITIDSKGVAHVISCGHHTNLYHMKSTSSDFTQWSTPEQIGGAEAGGGHTYPSLACDSQDNLHVITRYAGVGYNFNLVYNKMNSDGTWDSEVVLVAPNRAFYGIYYHKLSLGKDDKLYVNFTFLPSQFSEAELHYYGIYYPDDVYYFYPYQGLTAWTNPLNAKASDDSNATCSLAVNGISYALKAADFGFSIPSNETIEGIKFEVERSDDGNAGAIVYKSFPMKNGIPVGDPLFEGVWPSVEETSSDGGASDLHGTTWTYSDINRSTFGFHIGAKCTGPNATQVRVDHMKVTVYTDGGTYGPNSPGDGADVNVADVEDYRDATLLTYQSAHGLMMLVSNDNGDSWSLADQEDL